MQSSIHKPMLDTLDTGFTSTLPGGESSSRRQRIAMACQYCRHRKIKCCGAAPCANCTRARRTCDYSPVPEEVNRATREKKAAAKAAKSSYQTRAAPYYVDQSVYGMQYMAGPGPMRPYVQHAPLRRACSTPTMALPPYSPIPPAPTMNSPAQFDSHWFTGPPVPTIVTIPPPPMVSGMSMMQPASMNPDDTYVYNSYATTTPVSPSDSSASGSTQYPMPVTPMRKSMLPTPPHTPSTAYFHTPILSYTPQPFPFSPSPLANAAYSSSPRMCSGVPFQKQPLQPLVGLGIGLATSDEGTCYTPVSGDYLSTDSLWVKPEATYY